MEVINSLLSNDIGYINALRNAASIPEYIAPPEVAIIPNEAAAINISESNTLYKWIIAAAIAGVSIFLYAKWLANKNENLDNSN